MKNYDLTFVTCHRLPNMDPDDLGAFKILQDRGWRCQGAIWNDPAVDWAAAGLVVLRSTWDYHLHLDAFTAWFNQRSHQLLNTVDTVSWNINKRYLVDLQQRGVSVIPTRLVDSSKHSVDTVFAALTWQEIIVKPTVGLATYGVKRFQLPQEISAAKEHVVSLLPQGDVLIQQYMPAVTEYGERALSFIDGVYSHAIRKSPFQKLAAAGHAGETAVTATASEIVFAQKVLSNLPEKLLYARVDIVPNADGVPMLMELELIEPSLFLLFDAAASERFAQAIERRLQQRQALTTSVSAAPVFR